MTVLSLTWTPANDKGVSGYIITVTPVGAPAGKLSTGGSVDVSGKGTLTALPNGDVQQIHDYILVPPVESGLDPIYVMFNKPRKNQLEKTSQSLLNLEKELRSAGTNIILPQKLMKLRGWESLKQVDQKLPSSQEGAAGLGGMATRGVKFMSGTHSMVSWKDIVPATVNIWGLLIPKRVSS